MRKTLTAKKDTRTFSWTHFSPSTNTLHFHVNFFPFHYIPTNNFPRWWKQNYFCSSFYTFKFNLMIYYYCLKAIWIYHSKKRKEKKHCRKMNKKKMLQFRLVKNTLPFVFISFITRSARKTRLFSNFLFASSFHSVTPRQKLMWMVNMMNKFQLH